MSKQDSSRRRQATLKFTPLEDRTTPSAVTLQPDAYAADRLLVSFADTSANHTTAFQNFAGVTGVRDLGFGTYAVTVNTGTDLHAAMTVFGGQPGVTSVSPDYVLSVERTPNDPSFTSTWGLNNTGQSGGTADADIDGPEAWDVQTGTRTTIVAIIDTGVDYTHPDLAANMWVNPGEVAGDGIDNDNNGFIDDIYGADFANNDGNPIDDEGHGTHVAGTIGAVGNNGIGVSGVIWNTRIMALKFLDANGSGYTSNAVAALNYAIAKGASISNNSWGGGGAETILSNAISAARNAGHIFVAAAGNAGANNDTSNFYPANYISQYNNVVSVAATDRNDNLASFSNYGATKVTLAAPGVSIYSTLPNNSYGSLSGTSMATPQVTGALALLRDQNPTWSYTQLIDKLKSSVDVKANLVGKVSTGGRLNVAKMLDAGTVPPSPPPAPTDTVGARVTSATFSGSTATNFNKVRFTFNEAITTSTFTAADVVSLTGPTGAAITVGSVAVVSGTNNTQFDVTFASQTAVGTYTVTIGPAINDVAGNAMNQNSNTVNGENPGDRYTTSAALATGQFTFSAGALPLAIPDLGTGVVSIVVNQDIRISDLNIQLKVTHTYDSDLKMTLTGPGGQVVTLVNRRGGSGDNFSTTTFDDEATTAVTAGRAPFNGSYRPESVLSVFDNLNARGTWTLRVQDLAALDVGTVNSATLIITGTNGFTRLRTLALMDDEAVPPMPVGLEGTGSAVKFAESPLLGVWVGGDKTPVWQATTDQAPTRGRRIEAKVDVWDMNRSGQASDTPAKLVVIDTISEKFDWVETV